MKVFYLVIMLIQITHLSVFKKAEEYLNKGDYSQAEILFQKVLVSDPNYVPALKGLAEVKIRLNKLEEARALLKKASEIKPDDIGIMITLADVYSWLGDYDRSIALYKDAIEQDSTNLAALKGIARVLRWASRYEESIHYYLRVLQKEPDDLDALLGIARSYALFKNFERALSWVNKALEKYPDNPDALKTKADILTWANHFKEAEHVYKKLLKIQPNSHDVYQGLGNLYKWWGKYSESIRAYEEANRLKPNDPDILLSIAQVALKVGKYSLAKKYAEKLQKLEPNNSQAMSILQSISHGKGIDFRDIVENFVEPLIIFITLFSLALYFYQKRDILRRRHPYLWTITRFVLPFLLVLIAVIQVLMRIRNSMFSDLTFELIEILTFLMLLIGIILIFWYTRFQSPSQQRVVLAIGAHPDDIELGCGGTLAKFKDMGYKVFGIVMTTGEEGLVNSGKSGQRIKEAKLGAKILGLDNLWVYNFKDTELSKFINKMKNEIEKKINEVGADLIITQSPYDTHQDHKAVFEATKIAARGPKTLICYEDVSTEPQFVPNYFVDITDYIDDKIQAIKSHRTQRGKSYMNPENIRGRAAHRGLQVGVKFAEAFICVKFVSK